MVPLYLPWYRLSNYTFATPPRKWAALLTLFLPAKPRWKDLLETTGLLALTFTRSYALSSRQVNLWLVVGIVVIVEVALRLVIVTIGIPLTFALCVSVLASLLIKAFGTIIGCTTEGVIFVVLNREVLNLPAIGPNSLEAEVLAHL